MNYIDWCKEFFDKHPATSLGLLLGIILGLGFAAFGFWRTLVVAICVAAGLFVGWRIDQGKELDFDGLKNGFKERWQSVRRKQS